jgi:ABC-type spermidine/putrescine transport system permease subunit II
MTFRDVFKSSFLEKAVEFSVLDVALAMLLAFAIGLFIFYVYKKTYSGVMYSAAFGVSIMAMTMITTLIILAVTSNLVLSLGMVGALSIVRFRTAIKEPLDIAFLFWAISAGIVLGAGLIPLAIIGSLFIGLMLFIFVNRKSTDTPYIVVLNLADDKAEQDCMNLIKEKQRRI